MASSVDPGSHAGEGAKQEDARVGPVISPRTPVERPNVALNAAPPSREHSRLGATPDASPKQEQGATPMSAVSASTVRKEVAEATILDRKVEHLNAPPQIIQQRGETLVEEELKQEFMDIPIITEEIQYIDIPDIHHVEKIEEVSKVVPVPYEQLVEEIVKVPRILKEERVQQRQVEVTVDVPVPQVVEEALCLPLISRNFQNSVLSDAQPEAMPSELSTRVARFYDVSNADRDAAAEAAATNLAVQGFCVLDCGFKDKKKDRRRYDKFDSFEDGGSWEL
eukprot:s6709_g3.t1